MAVDQHVRLFRMLLSVRSLSLAARVETVHVAMAGYPGYSASTPSDVGKEVRFLNDGRSLEKREVEGMFDEAFNVNLQKLRLSKLPLGCDYNPRWIDSVKTLRFVSVLNLKKCGLTQLPPEIATMTALRRLRVQKNDLTRLPEAIKNLTELRILSAFKNQLQTLPSGMYELRQLRILRLGGNKLTARHLVVLSNDRDIRLLSESLWEIHLKDNPLLVINEIPQSFQEALKRKRKKTDEWTAAELDLENCPYRRF